MSQHKVRVQLPSGTTEAEVEPGFVDLETEAIHDSSGRRYDQAYIDQIVADTQAALSRGRPTLSKSKSGPSPKLQFRITPALAEAAARRAEAEHRTVSEVAREALERYLAS